MALKGNYTYRGVELQEAYGRFMTVAVLHNQEKGLMVQFVVYPSEEKSKEKNHGRYQLEVIVLDNLDNDSSLPSVYDKAYSAIKSMDKFSNWVDC